MLKKGDVLRGKLTGDIALVTEVMWFRNVDEDREGYVVTITVLRTGTSHTLNTLGAFHWEKVDAEEG